MRPFILLELLIAIALVSASMLPYIRYPVQHLSREVDTLFRMELSRQAEEILVDLQAMHRMGTLSKKCLDEERDELYETKRITITLPGDLSHTYERRTILRLQRKKKTEEKESALMKAIVSYHRPSRSKAVLQVETLLLYTEEL
jgi:hypothetical protein